MTSTVTASQLYAQHVISMNPLAQAASKVHSAWLSWEIGGLKPGLATVASMSNRVWPEKLSLAFERLNKGFSSVGKPISSCHHWSWVSFLGPETRDAGSTIWSIQWKQNEQLVRNMQPAWSGSKLRQKNCICPESSQGHKRDPVFYRKATTCTPCSCRTCHESMQGGCWKKKKRLHWLHPTEMWWAPLPFSSTSASRCRA